MRGQLRRKKKEERNRKARGGERLQREGERETERDRGKTKAEDGEAQRLRNTDWLSSVESPAASRCCQRELQHLKAGDGMEEHPATKTLPATQPHHANNAITLIHPATNTLLAT